MSKFLTISERPQHLLAPSLDYILLDASGSMTLNWHKTLSGLEAFRSTLIARASIHSHGILHLFSSPSSVHLEEIARDSLMSDWGSLLQPPIPCIGGGTPLYDAVNCAVRKLAELDPPRASLVIATDGHATGQQATSIDQARALLDWCRDKGWQVTFLGVDFNNWTQAASLGGTESNTLAIAANRLSEACKKLAEKRIENYRSGKEISFSSDEKENFGGYLTKA